MFGLVGGLGELHAENEHSCLLSIFYEEETAILDPLSPPAPTSLIYTPPHLMSLVAHQGAHFTNEVIFNQRAKVLLTHKKVI